LFLTVNLGTSVVIFIIIIIIIVVVATTVIVLRDAFILGLMMAKVRETERQMVHFYKKQIL
jgi:hypothetical protein